MSHHFSTAYLTDLKSQESSVYGGKDAGNPSEASDFHDEGFFSSYSDYATKLYCPYSIRESQQSMEYKYDVLLIYDPDENSYFVDKLMEHLIPQNLKIFDFLRDSPPGMPQRKVLQSALKFCRYTCVVITRKFLTNFWSQLKADMSIQDMLDNEEKLYSVIVVVMDLAVKKETLPLDLATLSPLFCSEKFFENRLKLAFNKTSNFPLVSDGLGSIDMSAKVNPSQLSASVMQSYSDSRSDSKHKESTCPDVKSLDRIPQEHGDNLFISPLPVSLFNTQEPASSVMHRAISITVSSTGNRQPTESSDQTSCEDSKMSTRDASRFDTQSQNDLHGFKDHDNFVKEPLESIFAAEKFSYSSCDQVVSLITSQSCEQNNFTEVDTSLVSNLSDLEISLDTPSASLALKSSENKTDVKNDEGEKGLNSVMSELEISSDPEISLDRPSASCVLENIASNIDAKEKGINSVISELAIASSSMPEQMGRFAKEKRSNEFASIGVEEFRGKSKFETEGQCQSLPADMRSPTVKKSSSFMDLVRGRFVRVRKSISFRHKKDNKQSPS